MTASSIVKALQQLDLSKQEAEVYLAMLQIGACNAGPIIQQTGLHRQYVYNSLDSLSERGLCTFVVRNGRRVFEPAPPSMLVKVQRERERKAQELLPELESISVKSSDRLAVTTFRGISQFQESLITALEEASKGDGILRVIGGGDSKQFYETVGSFYGTYLETGRRLKVKKYLLTSAKYSGRFKEIFAREPDTELRLSEYLSSPTYNRITPSLVTMEVYSKDPMVIQIWNKSIAQSHREHFEMLWQKAQKAKT